MKSSRPKNYFFEKIFYLTQNNSHIVLISFVLLFLLSVLGLRTSKIELDIYDVFDPHFQSSSDLFKIKKNYESDSQIIMLIHFKKDPKAKDLCEVLRGIKKIERFPEVDRINSVWTLRRPALSESKIWYRRQLEDPCNLHPDQIFKYTDELRRSHFRHLVPTYGNNMFLFDFVLNKSGPLNEYVEKIMKEGELLASPQDFKLKVHYLGNGSTHYYFKKILFEDSIYNLLVIMIMILLLRFFYGTWRSGIYLSLTLVASGVVLYGVLSIFGGTINILTNNLFLMTAVAGAADFIFVTQDQLKGNYERSFLTLIKPCFFTTLTTIVGFLSLNTSDLSIIKQFGNGAALGALCEWAMIFLFLPSFLKVFHLKEVWVNPSKAYSFRAFDKLESFVLPKFVLWGGVCLMFISIPSFFYLNDQDSPVDNLPSHHPLRKGHQVFKKNFNWEGQVYLYFPEIPEEEQTKAILSSLSRANLIYRIESPDELLKEWTRDLPSLKKELIKRDLTSSPLWKQYYSSAGDLRVPIYLYHQDLHSLRSIRDIVHKTCQGKCRLAGQRVVYLEYGEKISKTMIESFALSIFLVLMILLWLLKTENKLTYFFPLVISALMGPLAILSLLSLFQIPVTIVTSIFLAVMVGLAGDNAIQFLYGSEGELSSGVQGKARSSIVVTILMMAGSSMFLFQSLIPMKIMGGLFISGFLINLIGDLWGLKRLLK